MMPRQTLKYQKTQNQSDKIDDTTLVARIAEGDSDAFQTLYRRHSERTLKFLTGIIGNQAQAEEVLNEVFLAVWRRADRFEGRAQPLTWILSIARNQAISALRKKREVTGILDDVAHDLPDDADRPDTHAEKSADADVLRHCITKLSPAHQAIVDLVYYRDFSVSEAAEILSVPPNTVKTRMFYARKRLGGMLELQALAA